MSLEVAHAGPYDRTQQQVDVDRFLSPLEAVAGSWVGVWSQGAKKTQAETLRTCWTRKCRHKIEIILAGK